MPNSTAEIRENLRRFFEEVFPRGDDEGVDQLVHPDLFDHSSPPGAPQGTEDVKRTMHWLHSVFTDLRWEIHQIITEGDIGAVYCTLHGRHTGDFMGIPPTDRQIKQPYVQIFRFVDGKTIERWAVRDDLTLMKQLGVIPDERPNGKPAN